MTARKEEGKKEIIPAEKGVEERNAAVFQHKGGGRPKKSIKFPIS